MSSLYPPPGLYNHGNTCFINASLQAMASLAPFMEFLRVRLHLHRHEDNLPLTKQLFHVLSELQPISTMRRICNPSLVINALCGENRVLSHEQQCAFEFWHEITVMIAEEASLIPSLGIAVLLPSLSPQLPELQGSVVGTNVVAPWRQWKSPVLGAPGMLNPLDGLLSIRLVCKVCGHMSPERLEKFGSLGMPIGPDGIDNRDREPISTLTGCLFQYFSSENVADVVCESSICNGDKTVHERRTKCVLAPQLLCIHLSRSNWHAESRCVIKAQRHIKFPLIFSLAGLCENAPQNNENLRDFHCIIESSFSQRDIDIRKKENTVPFRKMNTSSSLYSLRAVIVHVSGSIGGHYYTYRRYGKDKWVRASDESVEYVDIDTVLASEAYMLLYESTSFN